MQERDENRTAGWHLEGRGDLRDVRISCFCTHAQGRLGYILLIEGKTDQWRRAKQSCRWFSATSRG